MGGSETVQDVALPSGTKESRTKAMFSCTVLLKDIRCQASNAGATANVNGRTCGMRSVRRARDGVECVVWEMSLK
jgi:hypothetical protein